MTDIIKKAQGQFEIKSLEDDFIYIEGYASTFGNMDSYGDVILKGAFEETINDPDIKVKLLYQHRIDKPLGVIDSLYEDNTGLYIKAKMPKDNSIVKDIFPLLKMGALGDFSIGFNIVVSERTEDGVRIISEVELREVSIVTIPANSQANITSVKNDEYKITLAQVESCDTKRDVERLLRSSGKFTNKACVALTSLFNKNSEDKASDSLNRKASDSLNSQLIIDELNNLKKLI